MCNGSVEGSVETDEFSTVVSLPGNSKERLESTNLKTMICTYSSVYYIIAQTFPAVSHQCHTPPSSSSSGTAHSDLEDDCEDGITGDATLVVANEYQAEASQSSPVLPGCIAECCNSTADHPF